MEFKGLTLNGTYYKIPDLVDHCLYEIICDNIPSWQKHVYGFIVEFLSPTETIFQPTSGTTGKARFIELGKEAMIGSAKMTCAHFGLSAGQKALLCLPIKYIAGKMMVIRAFVSGMDLILVEPSGKPKTQSFGQIDFCAMVPLQVANLIEDPKNFLTIKTLIIGGVEISNTLQDKLQNIPTATYETFGMAETCSHIALKKTNGEDAQPCFEVMEDVQLKVDKRGCLVIKAPFLTEEVVTNDMVKFENENCFRWLGRYDNVINSGGIKIHPETLEKEIEGILKRDVVILGRPHYMLGQQVIMVVESTQGAIDENQIMEQLKPYIPKHSVPKKVVSINKFPRNQSLKIDRGELVKLLIENG